MVKFSGFLEVPARIGDCIFAETRIGERRGGVLANERGTGIQRS
jgi:hypothetical protein